MITLPERTMEMAEAVAIRHKAVVIEPDAVQSIILGILGSRIVLAGLAQKLGLPQAAIQTLCEPMVTIMAHMGVTNDERRALVTALFRDLKEMTP